MAVKKTARRSAEGRQAGGEQPRAQTPPSVQAGRGSRSLEVRWIRRGPLPSVLIDRFGPFRDPIEQRTDRYLVDHWTPELSVKIRDAVQLDLKAYRGSSGHLRVPGGGGPLEVWEKWSFPLGEMGSERAVEGWLALDKTRHRRAFELTAQGLVERSVLEEGGPRCTFELTEVVGGGDLWWTLGFEASGAAETLEPSLRACVGLLLERPLPDGIKLPSKASMSYTRWLGQR